MFIEEIHIKNFRSILDQTIKLDNMTIFVGNNDAGKSNVLKALNLFFNGQTDHNTVFKFKNDYCYFAKKRKRKAEEIVISVVFIVPANFTHADKRVVWTKTWRLSGEHKVRETIRWKTGGEFGKSKVGSWLRKLSYCYVPAIKSDAYFSDLLGQMYRVFSTTIEKEIGAASQDFIGKIRDHTNTLSEDIKSMLGFASRLQLPKDLSDLFNTLDFETQIGEEPMSLKRRGDGIKVRHIPAVLKFLADKERIHHTRGDARQDTIWGYEEPENNVEYGAAFELANNLLKYNKKIQILITTHSPVFYNLQHENLNVSTYYAYKKDDPVSADISKTEFDLIDSRASDMDEKMGLLPIIAPHVREIKERLDTVISDNEKLSRSLESKKTMPIVFVEGINDKKILGFAWAKLYPGKQMPFDIQDSFDCHFVANTFRRCNIFKNYSERIFIGMLDFDEAFDCWKDVRDKKGSEWKQLESKEIEGLTIKHNQYNGYLFLLPVPDFRSKYASETFGKKSCLSIELLFEDNVVGKFCDEIETPGGGKILKIRKDKKDDFANSAENYEATSFKAIEPIFSKILRILEHV